MEKKVETLKDIISKAPIPAFAYKYYLEEFGPGVGDEANVSLTDKAENTFFKLLQPFLDHRYEDSECEFPMIFRYHDTELVHGMLHLASNMLSLMYFEKDMSGLITEMSHDDEDSMAFVRVSKLNSNQLKFTLWNSKEDKYEDEPIPIENAKNANNSMN